MPPKPPIFVEDHGDVTAYGSVIDAEAAVEAVDVRNEEFRFYDAEGLVLLAEVHEPERPRGRLRRFLSPAPETIRLVVPALEDRRPEELAEILRGFISRVGSARLGLAEAELATAPLAKLVDATVKFLAL